MSQVPSSVLFNRPSSSTPAITTEVKFIPDSTSEFSYSSSQFINIPIRTSIENAFLDARHSYLKFTIENTSATGTANQPIDLYFDGLASSIIKRFTITAGGITLSNIDNYNRLVDLLMEHWSSDDFQREMAILAGHTQKYGTDGEILGAKFGGIDGNNKIPAGQSRTYCIPIISQFLLNKLLPLCFMSNAFLTLNVMLEDPRVAFITEGKQLYGLSQIQFNNCVNYKVKNVEYVASIISFRDNNLVQSLGKTMLNEGLYIHGTDYTCYTHTIVKGTGKSSYDFNIPDRSQSMKYILNTFYQALPDSKFSNLQSCVAGTTSYQISLGGVNYPQSKPISYGNGNFIEPYLQLQRVSSNGYFSSSNHTNVELSTFSRQNPNSLQQYTNGLITGTTDAEYRPIITSNAGVNPAIVHRVARANKVYASSFVQCLGFESFANASGIECGINTALLNVPISIKFDRDIDTYKDYNGYGNNPDDGTAGDIDTNIGFPEFTMITWVAYDVIWKLDNTGLFTVLK